MLLLLPDALLATSLRDLKTTVMQSINPVIANMLQPGINTRGSRWTSKTLLSPTSLLVSSADVSLKPASSPCAIPSKTPRLPPALEIWIRLVPLSLAHLPLIGSRWRQLTLHCHYILFQEPTRNSSLEFLLVARAILTIPPTPPLSLLVTLPLDMTSGQECHESFLVFPHHLQCSCMFPLISLCILSSFIGHPCILHTIGCYFADCY